MGLDYWLVHLTWTLPPATLLSVAYWPFFTRLEIFKILFLITIAVFSTIPWDSYLIRNRIWSYPADSVVGFTIFDIPVEEVFFFVIQTYCTSLLYVILTKHLVLPAYLLPRSGDFTKTVRPIMFLAGIGIGVMFISNHLTYLRLILLWALPVLTFQFILCGDFLLALPNKPILTSILLPTSYLWIVDFFSLQRGTWVIEPETKVDIRFGGSLDLEEAIFFLVSNTLVVFGLVTVDHAIAIAEHDTMISNQDEHYSPSFIRIAWLYITSRTNPFDVAFLEGLSAAINKLAQKSQSMYLGSAMFQDRLRIDLILLYSFCRVIDDLVDEAPDRETAQANIKEASQVLHWRFSTKRPTKPLYDYLEVEKNPDQAGVLSPLLSSIALLPASRLTMKPLLELLSGFEMDLQFSTEKQEFPIATETDLELYAHRVAGTVAASLLELVFSHYGMGERKYDRTHQERIIQAGQRMGQALQYVNIARDIKRDAAIGRVYIPSSWLAEGKLAPSDVLANPDDARLAVFEDRMLCKAKNAYELSVGAIYELPHEARGPIRTTVESYMMIGEMVRKRRRAGIKEDGKLKVPLSHRLRLAWWEMYTSH